MTKPRIGCGMLLAACLLSACYGALAGESLPYVENPPSIFQEGDFQIPPVSMLTHGHWQGYQIPQPFSGQYEIALNSLSIGRDDVVRMVLRYRAPSGAQTTSFEGLRCKTYERKLYAFLNQDGTWQTLASARWQAFSEYASARHIFLLARDFLCQGNYPSGSVDEIVSRLRAGGQH